MKGYAAVSYLHAAQGILREHLRHREEPERFQRVELQPRAGAVEALYLLWSWVRRHVRGYQASTGVYTCNVDDARCRAAVYLLCEGLHYSFRRPPPTNMVSSFSHGRVINASMQEAVALR